jgi:hypothetical protein
MGYAKGEGREQGRKAGAYSLSAVQWRDSRCTMVFNSLGSGPKNRDMTWRGLEPRAADSLVAGISRPVD